MKRTFTIFTLAFLLFPMLSMAQSVIYSDNFDSYTAGSKLAVSNPTWWTPWSGTAGGTDDAFISNEQSSSSPNSVKFDAASAQGDYDMVLKLGNKTAGKFDFKFKMYIGNQPTHGGYFNMLHILPASAEWAFSIVFDPNLDIILSHNNVPATVGTYTKGTWLDIKVAVDLDIDSAYLFVNNVQLAGWVYSIQESGGAGMKQIAGVNFFTYAGGGTGSTVQYYIDDVEFVQMGGIGLETPVPFETVITYPNPTQGLIRFNLPDVKELKVFDVAGNLVGAFAVTDRTADLGSLPSGLYVVEYLTGNGFQRSRIVKL